MGGPLADPRASGVVGIIHGKQLGTEMVAAGHVGEDVVHGVEASVESLRVIPQKGQDFVRTTRDFNLGQKGLPLTHRAQQPLMTMHEPHAVGDATDQVAQIVVSEIGPRSVQAFRRRQHQVHLEAFQGVFIGSPVERHDGPARHDLARMTGGGSLQEGLGHRGRSDRRAPFDQQIQVAEVGLLTVSRNRLHARSMQVL